MTHLVQLRRFLGSVGVPNLGDFEPSTSMRRRETPKHVRTGFKSAAVHQTSLSSASQQLAEDASTSLTWDLSLGAAVYFTARSW